MPAFPKLILRQEWAGIGLAMIAAYVDGFGLLTFRTYLSFMSGNTTQTGCGIGQWEIAMVAPSALAILFFVVGVIAGNVLRLAVGHDSRRLTFPGISALLFLVVCDLQFGWFHNFVRIALISLGMGAMNTTVSNVGNEQLNIAFVTGTLNRFAKHVALAVMRIPLEDSQGSWDTQLRRAFLQAWVWTGFLGGAVLAGIVTPRLAGWTLTPPAIALLISAFFSRAQVTRSPRNAN